MLDPKDTPLGHLSVTEELHLKTKWSMFVCAVSKQATLFEKWYKHPDF